MTMKASHSNDPNSWDIIIFTQRWPYTTCYSWEDQNANHTCNFPPQKNQWAIHGLWFVILRSYRK